MTQENYGKTIGELIVETAEFKEFAKGNGQRSACIHLENIGRINRTTATTTGLTSIDKQPQVIMLGAQSPTIGELIAEVPTNNVTVRWIRENSLTNAASGLAEEGALPEASWDLTEVESTVRKIGVIAHFTDEILSDNQGCAAFFNQRLPWMVTAREDDELLNGDGTGVRILGLLNTAGILTQAQGSDTAPDAILKAITKIRTSSFFEPNAVVMNPNDWQGLTLIRDKNGQYLNIGPAGTSYGVPSPYRKQIWGLPVVITTRIAQGTCLVGAFNQGSTIHRRMGLTIETTNTDASDFKYNRIATRAVTRLALAVNRPTAFCTVTGLS